MLASRNKRKLRRGLCAGATRVETFRRGNGQRTRRGGFAGCFRTRHPADPLKYFHIEAWGGLSVHSV